MDSLEKIKNRKKLVFIALLRLLLIEDNQKYEMDAPSRRHVNRDLRTFRNLSRGGLCMEKGEEDGRWAARVAYFHGFVPAFLSWNALCHFFSVEATYICPDLVHKRCL
jgi:hypothetical protein